MAYTSAQIVQAVPTGINSALVLITAQTIGTTVSSVTVSSVFSATYDAYKIVVTGGVGSASVDVGLALGASTTGYFAQNSYISFSTAVANNQANNNASSWTRIGGCNTSFISLSAELLNPFLSKFTLMQSSVQFIADAALSTGYHGVATSFTAFTITPSSGTLTGGTIRVYGYTNS